jgi:hypothetical protein
LADNIPRIKQYLLSKGITEDQMTVSSISTTTLKRKDADGNDTSEITGYSLSQQIEIRSNDVQKVAQVAREATELINQGHPDRIGGTQVLLHADRRPES